MNTTDQEICAPLTSPGWTWVLPDFLILSFLVSGTTAALVPQFAVPSAVKRQMQKEWYQSTLSCEMEPWKDSLLAASLCQGRLAVGREGWHLGTALVLLWAPREGQGSAASASPPPATPVQLTVCEPSAGFTSSWIQANRAKTQLEMLEISQLALSMTIPLLCSLEKSSKGKQ